MFTYRSLITKTEAMMASSLFFFLIASSMSNIACGESSGDTLQRILPAYTIAANAETTLNSSACSRELAVFKDAVDRRKLWALKVLDSSGEPKMGFIYGNNYWISGRAQCLDVANKRPLDVNSAFVRNASRFRNAEEEFPPYKVDYFAAHFRHNSTVQYHVNIPNEDLVILGLCLPASCNTDELSLILEGIFRERTLIIGELYAADFKLENIQDFRNGRSRALNGKFIFIGIILAITLCLMILAIAYDVLVYQKYIGAMAVNSSNLENNTAKDQQLVVDNPEPPAPVKIKNPSVYGEMLKCFSVYTNTKMIFRATRGTNSLGSLDGIRFLAIVFIVTGHASFYTFDVTENKVQTWRLAGRFIEHLIVMNAVLGVDTFFFISGFLMTYMYFKRKTSSNATDESVNFKAKWSEFCYLIFKRYVRITPAYMMIIGIAEILSAWYAESSAFVTAEKPLDNCSKYWWRNLLYINNLFNWDDMCLTWSWYLSADMQFHVVGSFIMILSSVYFYAAASILLIILSSSIALTGYLSFQSGFEPTIDDELNKMALVYAPPWARIGPFIVGMITAYILVKINKELTVPRKYLIILWLLACFCGLSPIYGITYRQISILTSAFYLSLHRTIWGIGIGWLVIACSTNNGGILNTVLSFEGWAPLSKLAYGAYLINPLIIKFIYLNSDISLHVELATDVMAGFGILVLSFLCSYVYSLMMVFPYARIVGILISSRTKNL